MGILLETVKKRNRFNRCNPVEVKKQYFLDELKALNITVSRSGVPIEKLTSAELKHELALATILNIDIETPSNKFF